MNKPLLIFVSTAPTCIKSAEENLGIGYLTSVCKQGGYDIRVIDAWMERIRLKKFSETLYPT